MVRKDQQAIDSDSERKAQRTNNQAIAERDATTDLDVVMDDVVEHARKTVQDVWPGGTVNVDEVTFFWNTRLQRSAGKAYSGSKVPQSVDGRLAIGLAPGYFYTHGRKDLLEVVRHELIHIWQYEHPDGKSGHGPTFRQWLDDLNTHRHCKTWSRP